MRELSLLVSYVCMYVCMYVLHGIFLIYDQCIYSPENRYTNIFSLKYRNEQDFSICMYVCMYVCMYALSNRSNNLVSLIP